MTLASRLLELQSRIQTAARSAGRDPASVHLLPVSKTVASAQIAAACTLGCPAFGENYVQEALAKIDTLSKNIDWHLLGPLQSNKSRPVAAHFSWCQSVASLKLAQRLSAQRMEFMAQQPALAPLQICLQLHQGDEASKSGISADELIRLAEAVMTLPGIKLRGLMTIPPPSTEPAQQRFWFAQARTVFEQLQQRCAGTDCAVDTLSMGMSADLESAILEGSTMVRVGTALFGQRQALNEPQ